MVKCTTFDILDHKFSTNITAMKRPIIMLNNGIVSVMEVKKTSVSPITNHIRTIN